MNTVHAHAGLLTDSILADEIDLETRAVSDGVARYRQLARHAIERGQGSSLKPVDRLLLHWYEPLVEEIRSTQRHARRGGSDIGVSIWGEAMLMFDAESLAVITMHETMNMCLAETGSVRMSALAYRVGSAVLAEEHWARLWNRHRDKAKELRRTVKRLDIRHVNRWARKTMDDEAWKRRVSSHLGARLLWDLLTTASVHGPDEPYARAFHVHNEYRNRRQRKVITLDDRAVDIIEAGHRARQDMRPRYLPMIVQPYPWGKDAQGGYVKIRTPFVAKPTRTQKAALARADLEPVYERLNSLAAPGWRINQRVFRVMGEIARSGGGIAGIPSERRVNKPVRPTDYDSNEVAKKAWKRAAVAVHRENIRLAADRVTFGHKMAIAELVLDRPAIYFPHQFDFRGRAYPVPPHLNHHGDDVCRGLLESADAVPLGPEGAFWLRVQAADCFGLDKLPFEERVDWTDAHAGDIARVTSDPLGTVDWWAAAEKPWQFLAACYALDGDGTHHITDADGTCNGLQQYAALGRDEDGAAEVNMIDSDRPRSLYTTVADRVRPRVLADAATIPAAARIVAAVESGQTKWRTLVKQPTMTTVYGVTMIGARDQQRDVLKDAGLSGDALYESAVYLSRITLEEVSRTCVAAAGIMEWFRRCGRLIVATGEDIRWTTPVGFPVVQPYRRFKAVTITTLAGNLRQLVDEGDVPVKKGKQVSGMAPNYIHSLDKSHMLETSLECREQHVWFAAVHDCFKTHAGTRDRLNAILRERFVALHERPLLQSLLDEWQQTYPGVEFPDPPTAGTFDIRQVLNARYFFS